MINSWLTLYIINLQGYDTMRVGVIGAMEQEVKLLREQIENCEIVSRGGCEIYTGKINGVDVALLKSGIGKVAAAIGTTLLLEHFRPDVVINTGSAGGLDAKLNVGDIVVSTEVRYHDADVTAFGYEPGQMAQCPPAFIADPKLVNIAPRVYWITKIKCRAWINL